MTGVVIIKNIPIRTLLVLIFFLIFFTLSFSEDESILGVKATNIKMLDDRTEFYGRSEIMKGDFTLVSDRFRIIIENGEQRTVEATQGVFVQFSNGSATSTELNYDLKLDKGFLSRNVNALITVNSSTETVSVLCDYLAIDNSNQRYDGKNFSDERVKLKKGNMDIECDSFIYNGESEIIQLTGNVSIDEPGKRFIKGNSVSINLRTDEIDGEDVDIVQNSEESGEEFKMKSSDFKMFDDKIEFYRNSMIEKGNFSLNSDRFTVFRENGEEKHVEAREGVFVVFETGSATASELNYDLKTEKGKLRGDVTAVIKGKEGKNDAIINCDLLSMDIKEKYYEGNSDYDKKVNIYKGALYAECSDFKYDSNLEHLILSGDVGGVYISDPDNERTLWGEVVMIGLNDDMLDGTNVSMYINNDLESRINVKSQRIKMDDEKIEFLSNSEVSRKDFSLVADKFDIIREDGKEKNIVANDGVYVNFSSGKATGTTLDYSLDEEKGIMTGSVNASIDSKNGTDTVDVKCEKLVFDSKNGIYEGSDDSGASRVEIRKGKMTANCDEFVYDTSKNLMEMTGNVEIDDPENRRTVKATKIIYYLDDDTMEGENVNMKIITKK